MRALLKALVGDWVNLGFVAFVVAVEAALVQTGFSGVAAIIVPFVILGGVAWLATR